jgi:acyl-CoA synthetase (AMP-forming)/AMP-acid ligase II
MAGWLNLGQNLHINAQKFPRRVAIQDSRRYYTYPQLNRRTNQLAHALLGLGLSKGDKVGVLLENCIEIVEIYLATAKTGLIIVPINFRLSGDEVEYIINDSDVNAMVVHHQFASTVISKRHRLPQVPPSNYIIVGEPMDGFHEYEAFIGPAAQDEPLADVAPSDIWILIYTSGTTGKPKGVLRSHESHIAFYLLNAIDFGFNEHDICMNIMPLCHINSVYFTFLFTYIGASVYIHPAMSFKPEEILKIVGQKKITFISLIPTHYQMILKTGDRGRRWDISSIRKLLCSSAPVRKAMKLAIMDFFPGVELYEAYGSTEAGIVTILKPEYQMKKLGSIGFESLGTNFVKILDVDGNQVPPLEVGELYSRSPMLFDAYYKLPEKTAAAFRNGWFSAGDMAMKDKDGFYHIVDRKDNMIITGGEHVYPSEVENVIGNHECVFDCACIAVPDEKWGEKVVAVVSTTPGVDAGSIDEAAIMACCKEKLAGYKIPKEVIFIKPDEMPRTATGKIVHRKLREKFQSTKD